MRKLILTVSVLLGLGGSQALAQQSDWAVMPYVSHSLMFGDLGPDHPTRAINPGVGAAIQYGLSDHIRLYGDLSYFSINGGNSTTYFEHNNLQGLMAFQWDLLGEIANDSKLSINLDAGIGWSYFDAERYDVSTRSLSASVPHDGAYSSAGLFMLGGSISYPLSNQSDIYLGYRTTQLYDNDWGDAVTSGEAIDWTGQIQLGLRFAINGHEKMTKLPESEYDDLVRARTQAENERDEAIAELSSAREQYDAQIEDLYNVLSLMNNNIDSLEQKITVLRTTERGSDTYVAENSDGTPVSENSRWRIVIGSFPSAGMAQEFAAQQSIEGGEYEVVYIEDLNTYRVVYKSYNSLTLAKRDLERVKLVIANAWIIRF